MNKKYLAFLSAILIATISACGGSGSEDTPRPQIEPKEDPAPQPQPEPGPGPIDPPVLMTIEEFNNRIAAWNGIESKKALLEIMNDKELGVVLRTYLQQGFKISCEERICKLEKKN